MKIFICSTLAVTLCVAPAMAQPQNGAQMFPTQPANDQQPRPTEVNLQIKEDLQILANSLKRGQPLANRLKRSEVFGGESYIFGARIGFFGSSEWKRDFAVLLSANIVQIDDVKILARDGDAVKAAVAYSFKPAREGEAQTEFWKGARQEILDFKSGPMLYAPTRRVWQIVPPEAAPPAFNLSNAEAQDNLFADVAYHLAQKQTLETTRTPAERSVDNLKLLGLCVLQSVMDYNEVYAFEPRYFTQALSPYISDPVVFQVPDTNEIYTFNGNLSGLNQAKLDEVYQTVLFYEGQNQTPIFRYDGSAAICFADGHVELISPERAKSLIWKP